MERAKADTVPLKDLVIKELHQVTGIGRTIDLRYRSNRIVVAGTVAAAGVAAIREYLSDAPNFIDAGMVGVGAFLAWALSREIDPDRPTTATLAMVIAAALGLVAPPAGLAAAVLMLAMRVIVGSVGTHVRLVDTLVIAGSAALAATSPAGLPVAGAAAYALLRRRHRLAAALVVGAFAVAFLLVGPELDLEVPSSALVLGLSALAMAGLLWLQPGHVAASADNGSPIDADHVAAARRTLLASLLVSTFLISDAFVTDMGPALAAIAATGASAAQRTLIASRGRDK